MAIIKFKKGNGAPTGLTLAEPAFDLTNNAFYVGVTGGVKWVGAEVDNTTSLGTSQIKIPTQFAVKTYVDNLGLSPGVLVTSLNGVTGAVLLGVTAGVGLSIVNPTGSGKGITLINTGVLSVNGETGAVINVARTNTTNSFSSLQTFTNGVSIVNGATLSDILRIRGTITDPGGKIELWDEANTYKTTLQPEASTFKNTTFEFGGADGFVVAANTDGATSGWIVRAAGAGLSPTWIDPSATGFTAAGANIAVNLRAGAAGNLVYQTGANTSGFVTNSGTTGFFLTYNTTSNTPTWVNPNTIGFTAYGSTVTVNVQGGAAGSLPYNSAANTTTFLGIGANLTILRSNGSAPTWIDPTAAGFTAAGANIAVNLRAGAAGNLVYQTGANTSGFVTNSGTTGFFLTYNTTSNTPTWVNPNTIGFTAYGSTVTVNVQGGAAGSLPYNSAANTTTFLGIGSAGTILTSTGSAPQWSTATGLTVGTAQQVSVTAETADTTTYVTFVGTNSNSNQALEYNSSLVYNAVTNYLEANIDGGSF